MSAYVMTPGPFKTRSDSFKPTAPELVPKYDQAGPTNPMHGFKGPQSYKPGSLMKARGNRGKL